MKANVDAVFLGNEKNKSIPQILSIPENKLTEKDCRTFQRYIQSVLIYRTGQRPEWLVNLTIDDWNERIRLNGNTVVINLDKHKTKKHIGVAHSEIDQHYVQYFMQFFNVVRPRFVFLLSKLNAHKDVNGRVLGCVRCRDVKKKIVMIGASSSRQLFTTYRAFVTKSCGPFTKNQLQQDLIKHYDRPNITATQARQGIETTAREYCWGLSPEKLEAVAKSLIHSKPIAESHYVSASLAMQRRTEVVVWLRENLDARVDDKKNQMTPKKAGTSGEEI